MKFVLTLRKRSSRFSAVRVALFFAVLLCLPGISTRAAEPLVMVSVNGKGSATVFPGMPLLISGVFASSGGADCSVAPVILAAAAGPWTNVVSLEVRNSAGILQSWPLHTGITASNSVALTCSNFAQIDWWLTPAETSLLSTGAYTVDLILNTTNATLPTAWKGLVDAVPAELTLVAEPATLTEGQAENKYGQLAQYHLFAANPPDALPPINQLLASYSTNITGLRLKAEVLSRLGHASEALAACNQAITEVFHRDPNLTEPPYNLLGLRHRLQSELPAPVRLIIQRTGASLSLQWNSVPGTLYDLQASQDLQAWSTIAPGILATATTSTFQTNVSAGRQFFRLLH